MIIHLLTEIVELKLCLSICSYESVLKIVFVVETSLVKKWSIHKENKEKKNNTHNAKGVATSKLYVTLSYE